MESRWGRNHTLVRLSRWLPADVAPRYSFVNCIPDVVGPVYSARQIDRDWVDAALSAGYERVISLGVFPSPALVRMGVRHFVLPHPSGRNRLLNDPEFEREMVALCRRYLLKGSVPVRDDMKTIIGTVQGGPYHRLQPREHRPPHRWRVARIRARVRDAA